MATESQTAEQNQEEIRVTLEELQTGKKGCMVDKMILYSEVMNTIKQQLCQENTKRSGE